MLTDTNELFGWYTLESFPKLRCPCCLSGVLVIDEKTYSRTQAERNKIYMREHGGDPTETQYVCFAQLVCQNKDCGEFVNSIGRGVVDVGYGQKWEERYRPNSFFPSPALISLPDNTPQKVADLVKAASSVAWADYSAAINRLRVGVEVILDELGVRKKSRYDSVGKRLKRLPSAYAEHSETFSALNYVGNVGSHAEDVKREVLIKSFELYEYMLEELYGERRKKALQITREFIETEGKGK